MRAGHYPEVPPDFGHWLAGFIDGEGCFWIQPRSGTRSGFDMRFELALRFDDRPILEEIQARTGIGTLNRSHGSGFAAGHPGVRWAIYSKAHCTVLSELLRRYPLRAKKRHELEIWARAVDRWARRRRRGPFQADWSDIAALKQELDALRVAHLRAAQADAAS